MAMDMDDLILVSVDDHVIEPPNMFEDFMPAKYRRPGPETGAGRHRREVGLRRGRGPQRRAECGRRTGARGVRPGADHLQGDPDRLLRRRRAGQGHERQRRARLAELPLHGALLRAVLRLTRSAGPRPRTGGAAGLQRLAHRCLVRRLPRAFHPLHDPADLGPGADGGRSPPHRGQRIALRQLLHEPARPRAPLAPR